MTNTKTNDEFKYKGFRAIFHAAGMPNMVGWEIIDTGNQTIKYGIKTKRAVREFVTEMKGVN